MPQLPTQKSSVISELSKQNILIYGRAKIGKSTLCSKFDKPLFLATEAGLNHLEVYKISVVDWDSPLKTRQDGSIYGGFLSACKEIQTSNHDFKTVVIDTIDNLVIMCSDYICKDNGINHPSELPHGKGWHLVTSELNTKVLKLSNLPQGLVMVSHCIQEEVETKTKKYSRWTISIGGKNKNVFLNMADIILFIDSDIGKDGEEKRIIRTKPSMYWEGGDRTQRLPETMPLDYNELIKNLMKKEVK